STIGSVVHRRILPDRQEQRSASCETAAPLNLNAHAERLVRTLKESCWERLILFGEGALRKALHEFVAHYHHERNHQGLDNRLIIPEQLVAERAAAIQRRSRLDGVLNYYHRQAA